jgi:MarR family transcriptional regulator for hemolysin
MTPENTRREVAHKLPVVARGWRQLADAALADVRVSNSAAWCLIYLDRLGPQVRQTELAHAIGIAQPSAVSMLNQLEAGGLITRLQDPADKRANFLSLTAEGQALVGKIEVRLVDLRHRLFADMPVADIEAMLRVLDQLADRITRERA